ncbi:DNA polymerase kappa [Spea bombifrons]|uniref:DNA polymerase kappa n=1 Tax=Spea bombifrons TaxID=233779 RepID=UPI00234ADB84|nr:DNA polymerase kappa [Spea bombifrons]XP_053303930.1 DNA polymerase kappa [Spea bombifrons]
MDNTEEKEIAPKNDGFQFRMGLNDNKAGMEGLDKEKINKIIMDATKGSRFYDNELKRDQQVNQRIEKLMQQKAQLTSQQLKKAQIQVDRLALELEKKRDLRRVIVHIDMDAFYAAVEMRDNPELKDKPMAVGSMSMLSTSNYAARRFGVRAAMPGFIAKKLCPDLIIVPCNYDKYRAVSSEVRGILAEYDPNFLPLSLDEAYLDITDHLEERLSWPEEKRKYIIRTSNAAEEGALQGAEPDPLPCDVAEQEQCTSPVLFDDSPPLFVDQNIALCAQGKKGANGESRLENIVVFGLSAEEAVKEIRFRIEQKTTLTASAGIAPNMMLAKVCSDKNKPNGQYIIPHDRQAVMDFIKDLPIRKVPGVGKVTEKMLKALGITTCTDLYQQRALLSLLFSDTSWHNFLNISMGLGATHIERDGERKSMSTERTFSEMSAPEEQLELCQELCKDLAQDLCKEDLKGKTVTLKLKNVNFEVKTRASTVTSGVSTEEEIFSVAKEILKAEIDLAAPEPLRLRLMGVRVSGFLSEDEKKNNQKSITSFLCPGKTAGSNCVKPPNKADLVVVSQNPPRESFFNQKRAARQLKMQEPPTQEPGVPNAEEKKKPVCSEPESEGSVLQTKSQKADLICPICFIKQSSWDLEGFNEHIDKCLSKTPLSNETLNEGENVEVSRKGESDIKNNGGEDCVKYIGSSDVHTKNLINKIVAPKPLEERNGSKIGCEQDLKIGFEQMDHNHCALSMEDTQSGYQIAHEHVSSEIPPENNQHGDSICLTASVSMETTILICPVCNSKQNTTDLAAFNRHVDVCLNKGILEELTVETGVRIDPTISSHQHARVMGKGNQSNTTQRRKRPSVTDQNPVSKKSKPTSSTKTIDRFFK